MEFFLSLTAPLPEATRVGKMERRLKMFKGELGEVQKYPGAPYSCRGYENLYWRQYDPETWALPLFPFNGTPWEIAQERVARLKALDPYWGTKEWRLETLELSGIPVQDIAYNRIPSGPVDHMLRPIAAPPPIPPMPERFSFWMHNAPAENGAESLVSIPK